jgi:hypothetical protein
MHLRYGNFRRVDTRIPGQGLLSAKGDLLNQSGAMREADGGLQLVEYPCPSQSYIKGSGLYIMSNRSSADEKSVEMSCINLMISGSSSLCAFCDWWVTIL